MLELGCGGGAVLDRVRPAGRARHRRRLRRREQLAVRAAGSRERERGQGRAAPGRPRRPRLPAGRLASTSRSASGASATSTTSTASSGRCTACCGPSAPVRVLAPPPGAGDSIDDDRAPTPPLLGAALLLRPVADRTTRSTAIAFTDYHRTIGDVFTGLSPRRTSASTRCSSPSRCADGPRSPRWHDTLRLVPAHPRSSGPAKEGI